MQQQAYLVVNVCGGVWEVAVQPPGILHIHEDAFNLLDMRSPPLTFSACTRAWSTAKSSIVICRRSINIRCIKDLKRRQAWLQTSGSPLNILASTLNTLYSVLVV